MKELSMTIVLALAGLVLAGCVGGTAEKAAAPAENISNNAQNRTVLFANLTYQVGNHAIQAIECIPNGTDAQTPGLVLTGGDGVTADKLLTVCDAFAKQGFVAMAHDNVENGTALEDIEAVVEGARLLRTSIGPGRSSSPSRPVALWGHSAGTIFSLFAAYDPSVRPYAFIDTSGHMQVPVCDKRGQQDPATCMAYLDEFPAPILIVHGLDDKTVAPSFAQMFAGRLTQNQIRYQSLYVPDAGHEFMIDKPGVLQTETDFLRNSLNSS